MLVAHAAAGGRLSAINGGIQKASSYGKNNQGAFTASALPGGNGPRLRRPAASWLRVPPLAAAFAAAGASAAPPPSASGGLGASAAMPLASSSRYTLRALVCGTVNSAATLAAARRHDPHSGQESRCGTVKSAATPAAARRDTLHKVRSHLS